MWTPGRAGFSFRWALVEQSSHRFQQFRSRAGSLRFHGSDGNSQNASCFADRKMIHITAGETFSAESGIVCAADFINRAFA